MINYGIALQESNPYVVAPFGVYCFRIAPDFVFVCRHCYSGSIALSFTLRVLLYELFMHSQQRDVFPMKWVNHMDVIMLIRLCLHVECGLTYSGGIQAAGNREY
eukprot:301550_1